MATRKEYLTSRFNLCGKSPLFYPDDDGLTYELIRELIERKRFVRRPSQYHLKHRKVNYYPSTEVITVDGQGRHPETGPDAFLDLLDQLYPQRPAKADPLSLREPEAPQPAALILDISLDDEQSLSLPSTDDKSICCDGDLPW